MPSGSPELNPCRAKDRESPSVTRVTHGITEMSHVTSPAIAVATIASLGKHLAEDNSQLLTAASITAFRYLHGIRQDYNDSNS